MPTPLSSFRLYDLSLDQLSAKDKLLINTINAHCYNLAQGDPEYLHALRSSDVLLPDGISIVLAIRWLTGKKLRKIAGDDLFRWEMERMDAMGGKVFFLGSSERILLMIQKKVAKEYPHIKLKTYSPPFKPLFTIEDNLEMVTAINAFIPDVLFVGMTAPKQEKWSYANLNELKAHHICCIGAVFDFYAGTIKRAPAWIIRIGFEWFYRLIKEPRRLWRRYLVGNTKFSFAVIKEFLNQRHGMS
ncbi:MAG: WecB/TagA/CpsF family glycosyltransferase [Bacteroidota bacterium]|nr:WecB/TagA/CpsF family glycosyltransferase [Bacteroidota bacterium]